MKKGFILAVISLSIFLLTSAACAQLTDWEKRGQDDSVLFLDRHQPENIDNFGNFPGQAWKAEDKEIISGYLDAIREKAPGLLQRVTFYRPLKLFYQDNIGKYIISPNLRAENAIVFTDLFFSDPRGIKVVAHEITHLADSSLKVANSKEWVDLVRPRIEKVKDRLKNEGMTLIEAIWIKQVNRDEMARQEGLPSLYAASDEMEALSEYTAAIVTGDSGFIPAAIRSLIEKKLLSAPTKPDESIRNFEQGLEYLVSNDLDSALAAFGSAIKLDPKFASAYEERSKAWLRKGDMVNAVADISEAIKSYNIGKVNAMRYDRAELLSKQKKWDEAIADYSAAAESNPSWSYPLVGRANAYINKKDYDLAIADYDRIIKINPQDVRAYILRGDCRRLKGEFEAAVADLSQAISLKPDYAAAYFWRGVTYKAKGDYPSAKKDFDEALRLDPKLQKSAEPFLRDIGIPQ